MNSQYKLLITFFIGLLSGIGLYNAIDIGIFSSKHSEAGLGFVFIVTFLIFITIALYISYIKIKLDKITNAKKDKK
tara:strand:+ start:973 stop:1200 length:228 start_codon:yes stop_codon:yes gene_type:complete